MSKTFNASQQELINKFKESYDKIDLTKGFYWQIYDGDDSEMFEEMGCIGIIMTPKEPFDTEGLMCDQSLDVTIFFEGLEDQHSLGELAEGYWEFIGDEASFKAMISKYTPFFEEALITED